MTLQEAIESFLFHCRYERNLSPKTLRAYGTDLSQMHERLKDSIGSDDVAILSKVDLRQYIRWLFEQFKPKSVKRKVASTKMLFNFLEREEVLTENPFRRMGVKIKQDFRVPRTIPLRDIERLFQYLYSRRGASSSMISESCTLLLRDIAVLETLFATAARVSEICNLRIEDVDLKAGTMRIFGKGARERVVQLCGPEIIAALDEYDAARQKGRLSPYFFLNRHGERMSEQAVRGALRRHATAAGVCGDVRPHLVRHSVATLLLEEGVDIRHIQHLLGHSSISTTELYTHIDGRSQRQALGAKHPRRLVKTSGTSVT